jgi:tRNA threonylcarbamoyladenosine biosynthesis protein TsaB
VILYLDTRGPDNEVELYDGTNRVAGEKFEQKKLSEQLAITVERLLKEQGSDPQKLTGIVVRKGPGSFTGLRIGLSYANGLAFALDIPLVGLAESEELSEVLAHPLKKEALPILPFYGGNPHITKRKNA